MAPTILRPISQAVRFLGLVIIFFAFAATAAFSQSNPFDTGTPAESRGGLVSHSSYAQDKIETINLATGNLSVNIPLVTIGGRGSATYTVALSYNSKLWTGQSFKDINDEFHSGTSFDDGLNSSPNRIAIGCGWFISKGPVIKTKLVNIDRIVSGQGTGNYFYVLTRLWLVLPDGSEVELRDNATDGQPGATAPPMHLPIDRDRGRVWHSTDGSAITYVTDAANGVVNNQLAGYVYLADGTRLKTRPGGSCSDIIDRNGNYLHINYNSPVSGAVTYTDDLGRQVILQGGSGGATVTVNGYNGVANRFINIITDQIVGASNNLRSDFQSLSMPIISGDYANGIDHFVFGTNPHTDVFFRSDMAATNVGGVGGYIQIDTQTPVTRLDLLDGRSFRFRYNQFGELAEIVYPGGGVSQIDYLALGSTLCEGWTELNPQLNRGVSQRRSLTDGVNTDATWEYLRGTGTVGGTNYPTVRVKVHQGSIAGATLMDETHYFLALNAQYLVCTTRISNGTGYDTFENNRELRVERQTGNLPEVVSRVWAQRAAVVWPQPGYPTQQPPNDPRVTQEDTIIENGKMKQIDYTYDPFNNVTLIKEYHWGTSGNPGPLARQTERTYVTNLNSYCYTNLNGLDNACGSIVPTDPARVIHRRRLLLNETIRDGSLNVEAYAEHEYDNYVDDGVNHAPLVSNPGMFQYDGTWFAPFAVQNQPRGNVTQVRNLVTGSPQSGTFSVSSAQYDEAGNVVKTIDPLGRGTTVSYLDNFGDGSNPDVAQFTPASPTFALPTLMTNALNQQVATQYDYTRGIASGIKDPNGTITKSEFDIYDRLTRVTAAYASLPTADTAITEMSYPSVSANESKVSRQLDSTRWLSSRAQYDGFGGTILASQAEDGAHFNSASFTIHSKTLYDGLGRAVKVTNPYRSSPDSTDGWTRAAFDVAGRVIDVATFSGSPTTPPPDYPATTGTGVTWTGSVTTTYGGDQTTVTDQAGKKRRSTVNSLGQLVQVDELNEDGSLYAATNYSYDARGNLLTTTQAVGATTQTRRFAYDALSRLIFAANPEQNTSSNALFTYNGQQWAMRYVYDAASNLTDKTDTRPVGLGFVNIHYDYDLLNRVFQRIYNDGTPQVNYVYDTATNGVGRLRSVTAGGVSTYNYTTYDALGRPTAYNQVTEGQTYLMTSSYNKAGMMVDEMYPSQKVMHTEYDGAGRPAGVKKTTNTFYYAGSDANDASNRVQYSAHGAMSVMKLGNGLWEHTNFNSRLQPTQIGLGTGQTSSSVLGLDYTYGVLVSGSLDATKNNGNIQSQTITPAPGKTYLQSYVYDSVNRLGSVTEKYNNKAIWTQSYGFDRWGNRTSLVNSGSKAQYLPTQSTPPVDSATNRLAGASYDAAGNWISAPGPYNYDAESRMTRNRINLAYVYAYDGDGRRVRKQDEVSGDILVFVYSAAGQMVAEYSSIAGSLPNVKVSYLTADHLSSTRVVTDGTGAVVARHDYMPYGEEIPALVARTGIAGYGAADGIRQKFTQKERDSESGLDYFGARYYSSAQGRFTSTDLGNLELGNPQSLNRYQYALNNPLFYVDPDGKQSMQAVRRLGKVTLSVYRERGESVDFAFFLFSKRTTAFWYKEPIPTYMPVNSGVGGCLLGCLETYEQIPAELDLDLTFSYDKSNNVTSVIITPIVDLDVPAILPVPLPTRTVFTLLPGFNRPLPGVTDVRINTSTLRQLTNNELQALGRAAQNVNQKNPIAKALGQAIVGAVSEEQKRRDEERRKKEEEEKKKKKKYTE